MAVGPGLVGVGVIKFGDVGGRARFVAAGRRRLAKPTGPVFLLFTPPLSSFPHEKHFHNFLTRRTARPAALEFYYQLRGNPADSAAVLVRLTRNVNGTAVLVAEGFFVVPAEAVAYTLARVPLHYFSSLAPDSVMLRFTSDSVDQHTDGTTLLADAISLTGTVLAARLPATSPASQLPRAPE